MYGIALAASGMLGTIATYLASDNAAGIAEMAGMVCKLCEITDALDARMDNTLVLFLKNTLLLATALLSVALFGAFISRARIMAVNVSSPKVFIGLIVKLCCLPYCFSTMAMTGVGKAALKTVEEMSTDASLKKMIPTDALVILTPLVVGNFFGVHTCSSCWLTGFCCAGCYLIFERRWGLVRIMQRNTWSPSILLSSNAVSIYVTRAKGDLHKAAVISATVGIPLKDTSGPSLSVLSKLMAVESLMFALFFSAHGGLLLKLL
ncbi:unnamed protein product [Musa hybrid cultivar]